MGNPPVTLDLSKSQPIDSGVTLDLSQSQPLNAPQQTATESGFFPAVGRTLSAFGERAKELVSHPYGTQPGQGAIVEPSGDIKLQAGPSGVPPSQAWHRLTNGDITGGIGEGLANIVAFAAPLVAGKIAGAPETATLRKGAVGASEPFVGRPQQAEALANAINVPPNQVEPLKTSLTHEAGSVIDFAKRSGIPLDGLKDFSQAAQGAGEEANGIYRERVIDPIKDEPVTIRGPQGIIQTTIGSLDDRITRLNDELRSNYQKSSGSQTREAQVRDAEINAELDLLRPRLYQEIAQRTNLNVQQVQDMRQHFGRLFDIADRTNFAANDKTRAMLNEIQGQQTSKSMSEAAFRVLNQIRGGPLGKADSMLRDALPSVKMNPYDMPDVQHMNQPISLNIGGNP